MRSTRYVVAVVSTIVVGSLSAQSADFSGRWRVNHAAGSPPSQSTVEQIWDVTQTSAELVVRVMVNGREVSTHTWPLGGPAVATRRDGLDSLTSATLANGELLISGEGTAVTGRRTEVREHWLIDPKNKSLRVAKTLATEASTFTRHLVLERVVDRQLFR